MKPKPLRLVIAGLDPAIHGAAALHLLENFQARLTSMDARVKPAHDE
ncbi:MAG: hypothetical protein WB760_26940 [Xanthobacteraceae bacterium]